MRTAGFLLALVALMSAEIVRGESASTTITAPPSKCLVFKKVVYHRFDLAVTDDCVLTINGVPWRVTEEQPDPPWRDLAERYGDVPFVVQQVAAGVDSIDAVHRCIELENIFRVRIGESILSMETDEDLQRRFEELCAEEPFDLVVERMFWREPGERIACKFYSLDSLAPLSRRSILTRISKRTLAERCEIATKMFDELVSFFGTDDGRWEICCMSGSGSGYVSGPDRESVQAELRKLTR